MIGRFGWQAGVASVRDADVSAGDWAVILSVPLQAPKESEPFQRPEKS